MSLQVSISEATVAQCSAPPSEPAKLAPVAGVRSAPAGVWTVDFEVVATRTALWIGVCKHVCTCQPSERDFEKCGRPSPNLIHGML
jgi:hypothetical protein